MSKNTPQKLCLGGKGDTDADAARSELSFPDTKCWVGLQSPDGIFATGKSLWQHIKARGRALGAPGQS